jgi:Domain of unknown function (DUF5668)
MKCHYHPEMDGLQECRLCGHPLCGACAVEIQGAPYCRECLQSRIEQPFPAAPVRPPSDMRSPKVAGWLSVMPGVGLLYLGQYVKALTVVLIVIGACHIANESEAAEFLGPLAWVGQIVYTVQEARRLRRASGAVGPQVPSTRPAQEPDSPLWGGILIGIGVLFLLDQFDMLSFGEIFERFWPALIIVLGIQILLRGRREGARSVTS